MKKYLLLLLLLCLTLTACQSKEDVATAPESEKVTASEPTEAEKAEVAEQTPPGPPLLEDFQASPQLSLFPRAGAFRPEDGDEQLPFWRTFIDHLSRTSGPVKTDETETPNIAFSFRAVKGIDSMGLFSPLAVTPDTTYEIRANISCDLVEGATAGIGILEFDKFLWIGQQYPESLAKERQVGTQPGISLSGLVEKQDQSFTFTTGSKTEMIHLVFFRDGEHDRNPVIIDDIEIKKAEQ